MRTLQVTNYSRRGRLRSEAAGFSLGSKAMGWFRTNEFFQRTRIGFAFLLVLGISGPSNFGVGSEDLDFYLRQDLEIPLKSKASKLAEEKNEEGHSFQRCYYSKMFHKIDENTYQSMFTKDLVVQEKMRTERYLLTLKKSKKGWEVAQEELQDTYEKLIRVMPGDEKFYRFDSFQFDREGLKISSSSGSVVVDFLQGKPNSIGVTGVSLAYDYEPPLDLSFHHNQRYQHLKSEKEEDFVFEPEIVGIFCDEFTCQEFLDSLFTGLQETSVENLDPDLRKFYNKADKEQREARRATPFTGFQLLLEPDRRNYTVAVKKRDHDHWLERGRFRFRARDRGNLL